MLLRKETIETDEGNPNICIKNMITTIISLDKFSTFLLRKICLPFADVQPKLCICKDYRLWGRVACQYVSQCHTT